MNLAWEAAQALREGRAAAESLMVDVCTVRRVSGSSVDPATGAVTPTSDVVYSGPCKVQQKNVQVGSADAGGHSFTVQSLLLDLPVPAGPFMIGDIAEIDASPYDANGVGRVYRMTGEHHKSWATAQRIPVEEVQG